MYYVYRLASYYILCIVSLCLATCTPSVSYISTNLAVGNARDKNCDIDVYLEGQNIERPTVIVGKIDIGDTGFTIDCSMDTVLQLAKNRACAEGANAIKIIQIKEPDFYSTCYRMNALLLTYTENEADKSIPSNKPEVQGTGFLLSESGYVVTNHHVVENQTEIKVVFPHKNATFEAEVQIKDTNNDLVILRLKGFTYNKIFAEEMPYAFKPSGNLKLGMQVFTLGFPLGQVLGKSVKFSDGMISALSGIDDNASLFQISNPIQPGNSGGPLLDKDCNLIGVVVASLNAKLFLKYADTIPQNVNFAIKSDYLINLISMLPEGESILDRNGKLAGRTLEEQVETMVPYVVTVLAK